MASICLDTATSITGLTKRTLWRRIRNGTLKTVNTHRPGEKTRVRFDDVLALSRLTLEPEDTEMILAADGGEAEAQCELGLLLWSISHGKDACYWLTLAAKQFHPNAMCYLGRGHLCGEFGMPDEDSGTLWLSQAAVKGHAIAQHLLRFLQSPQSQPLREGADTNTLSKALDTIERRVILEALRDSVSRV
ncbi:MAG: hypothetical protein C1943_07790 [Halochromatium sp.]|nr:hypothetical protein [Halochromatium sp.]